MKEVKSAKSNHQEQHEQIYHQNGHLGSFKFAKLFDSEASWDKDQLGDVLHWIRQVVGLLCGLVWGAIPLVGGIWLLLFLVISSGIVYGYYALILKIDEEDFGGHAALLQDGLFASLSLFLEGGSASLIWRSKRRLDAASKRCVNHIDAVREITYKEDLLDELQKRLDQISEDLKTSGKFVNAKEGYMITFLVNLCIFSFFF